MKKVEALSQTKLPNENLAIDFGISGALNERLSLL
jgi:hypothetical protein